MTIPFLPGRAASWASGRAVRTLPMGAGLAIAQEMAQMSGQQVLALIDRFGQANWDLAHHYPAWQGRLADTPASIAWCRGLIAELDFTPVRNGQP